MERSGPYIPFGKIVCGPICMGSFVCGDAVQGNNNPSITSRCKETALLELVPCDPRLAWEYLCFTFLSKKAAKPMMQKPRVEGSGTLMVNP